MKTVLYFCLLMIFNVTAFAVSHKMDCQSKTIEWQQNLVKLNTVQQNQQPILYFIKNISKNALWLNHPLEQDPGAKAGWSSYLKPNHWSALLLNRPDFLLNCSTNQPGNTNALNCKTNIQVCLSAIKLDEAMSGSYWFVENQSSQDFFSKIEARLSNHSH